MITSKQILTAIGCPHLTLIRVVGKGYWYFQYDDGKKYDTQSVYVPRLNMMSLERWVEDGKELVEKFT